MSARRSHVLFLLVSALTAGYTLVFPVLAVDTLVKVAEWAPMLERRNLLLLLFLESSKLFTSTLALAAAAVLIFQRRTTGARALALGLLFSAITFEKVLGIGGFPGHLQEWLARALIAAGVAPGVLRWLFGPLAWSIWPAGAALLHFSAVFPRQLEPAALQASGADDRRGWLRDTGVAGVDVGAWFRAASKRILEADGFSVGKLTILAVIMMGAQTALAGTAAGLMLWVVALAMAGVAVTNVRAAYIASAGADRARIAWIIEGFVVSLFMFLIATAVMVLVQSAVARIAALALLTLIPATIMLSLALSVLQRGLPDARAVIMKTVRAGAIALSLALAAAIVFLILSLGAQALGRSRTLASAGTAIVVVFGYRTMMRFADKVRMRVFERSEEEDGN